MALSLHRNVDLAVVHVIQALGSEKPAIDGSVVMRRFAHAYGVEYRYLPVPLLVEDARTGAALVQLPKVRETLNHALRHGPLLEAEGTGHL